MITIQSTKKNLYGDSVKCPTCTANISSAGRGALTNHMNSCNSELANFFISPTKWQRPVFALDLLNCNATDWAKTREYFCSLWGTGYSIRNFKAPWRIKKRWKPRSSEEDAKFIGVINRTFTMDAASKEELQTLEHYRTMEELKPKIIEYNWFHDDIFGEDDKTFTAPKQQQEIWINHPALPKIVEEYIPQQESSPIPQTIAIPKPENQQTMHVDDDGAVCVPHEMYQILINGGASVESIKEAYAKHAPMNIIVR